MPSMSRMFCSCLARLPRMTRMPRWLGYCIHSSRPEYKKRDREFKEFYNGTKT